ncbi:pilus assembly protein [Catenulispora sp. NL8]|uniref:Pilus assembly protein n=1 Tax=Catenulispora pinistramenti TaxID=2705254 RepID=A0ABS5L1R9_9ACTN|nr:TadE/TadG family type IV pilus assembly protein [Catenulispora pinistramenti]MBS2552268.1 pilus assembly protein [Catenulispora pinistramenti]
MTDGVQDGDKSRGGPSLRDDRGMTAIEFVVLTPLLFLLLMLTVQFALYLFAKQAATAAVQGGARTAREEAASKGCDSTSGSWQQDAVAAAVSRAQALGGQLVLKPTVTTGFTMDPNLNADCKISLVRVDLHSNVPSVFPGFGLTIDVHAGGPLEQPVRHP